MKGSRGETEAQIKPPKLEELHTFELFSTRRDREGDAQRPTSVHTRAQFPPTVYYVHGAAELVAQEEFKGFKRILFPSTNPNPGCSTFQWSNRKSTKS